MFVEQRERERESRHMIAMNNPFPPRPTLPVNKTHQHAQDGIARRREGSVPHLSPRHFSLDVLLLLLIVVVVLFFCACVWGFVGRRKKVRSICMTHIDWSQFWRSTSLPRSSSEDLIILK